MSHSTDSDIHRVQLGVLKKAIEKLDFYRENSLITFDIVHEGDIVTCEIKRYGKLYSYKLEFGKTKFSLDINSLCDILNTLNLSSLQNINYFQPGIRDPNLKSRNMSEDCYTIMR